MKRDNLRIVTFKWVVAVPFLLLTGCATPKFLKTKEKGPSPADTVVHSAEPAYRMRERMLSAPTRPEEEEIIVVEPEEKAKPSGAEYTVRKGDCLYWIAKRYNVKFSELLEANNLSKDAKLAVGQKIFLPGVTEAQLKSFSLEGSSYKVQRGDCLSSIAQKYGLSVRELKVANNLKSDKIVAGKTLTIPERGRFSGKVNGKAPASRALKEFVVDKDGYYKVQKGDSLSAIATRAKVSVADLQDWNNILEPQKLQIGQSVKVRGVHSKAPIFQELPKEVVAPVQPLGASQSAGQSVVSEPSKYDFLDDADFFGKIDDIPVVQVHE